MRHVTQRWPWPTVIAARPRALGGFRRGPRTAIRRSLRAAIQLDRFRAHTMCSQLIRISTQGASATAHGMPIMHHLVGMNRDKLGTYDSRAGYSRCVGPHVDRNDNLRKTRAGEALNQE
jgi:hypothetical protein